tara:strand:+ start:1974 stop:2477 length:504 start_codon:yes stop_codon:yes gene_type:complete
MKRVYLVRHAKSSREDSRLNDFERPLNERGESDAALMAEVLKKRKIHPDKIICSSSKRTLQTAHIFAKILGYKKEDIRVTDKLYLTPTKDYIKKIQQLNPDFESVLIIGHNPSLTELANDLSGSFIDNIPTCGIVSILYKDDGWGAVGRLHGKMSNFDFPKKYKTAH